MADLLKKIARIRRWQKLQVRRSTIAEGEVAAKKEPPPLMKFIPSVSKHLLAPKHLQPFIDAIESTVTRERRFVVSTPPQHGKTEAALHGLVWLMLRDPTKRHAYVTYESTRAEEMSLKTQYIGNDAGLTYYGSRKIWKTSHDGGLIATGIGGPLTGYGVSGLLLLDDPIKNRAEAESAVFRERTHQWFRDVAMTRVHPGASVIVIQTRWHLDDLAGRLIRDSGWEFINLPAIDAKGKPLWPERRPLDWLETQRKEVGEYTWASLYQGEPRPKGGELFRGVAFYEKVPEGANYIISFDLAYTAKTSSDYCCVVVLARKAHTHYVVEVFRRQLDATSFMGVLVQISQRYPGAPLYTSIGHNERIVIDFFRKSGLRVNSDLAVGDKYVRSQETAAAWNAGKILVKKDAPWVQDFLNEVLDFVGKEDVHDDQVDALVNAYNAFNNIKTVRRNVGLAHG